MISKGVTEINLPAPLFKESALMTAARYGNLQIVKLLLENDITNGANINYDNKKFTALSIAAALGHLNIVKFLVENGADINRVSESIFGENTALIWAVREGHEHIVQYLLDKGTTITSAVFKAVKKNNDNIITILKKTEPFLYEKIKFHLFLESSKEKINATIRPNQQGNENNSPVPKI